MNPSDLSSALRRVAAALENSITPSRALVAQDLTSIIYHLSSSRLNDIIYKIYEINHDLLLGDINVNVAIDKAMKVWGENTTGSDIVKNYIRSSGLGFRGQDAFQAHEFKREAIRAKNAFLKLVRDLKNEESDYVITDPEPDVDHLKQQVIIDAYNAALKQKVRSPDFNKGAHGVLFRYKRELEHCATGRLKDLLERYKLPDDAAKLINDRETLTNTLAEQMGDELLKPSTNFPGFSDLDGYDF